MISAMKELLLADAAAIAITAAFFLAVFALAEGLYRWGAHVEHTRKVAHVGAGLWTMMLPWILRDMRSTVLLAAVFCALLGGTRALGLLPSIHRVERQTLGSVLYPLGVVLAVPITWDRP